jgi:CMP-N-acetylneuraminic acid synthetase
MLGQLVVSVTTASEYPSQIVEVCGGWLRHASDDWRHPRQKWAGRRIVNGAVYAARLDAWRLAGGYFGRQTRAYEMPPERSWDIDTPFDLKVARLLAEAS